MCALRRQRDRHQPMVCRTASGCETITQSNSFAIRSENVSPYRLRRRAAYGPGRVIQPSVWNPRGPPGPGGSVSHAQFTFAEGAIMIGRPGGEFRPPRPNEVSQYVVVHVEDVNAHFEHARQCGAQILKPPTDMPFGERQYTVVDPWGHRWTFSQSIADVALEAWGARRPGSGEG